MGELLRGGFDVHQTLVDDQGIDCIVRQQEGDQIRSLETCSPEKLLSDLGEGGRTEAHGRSPGWFRRH